MNLLLDTCAALWIAAGDDIAPVARGELFRALQVGEPVYLSPITAWEVGLLSARRRIALGMAPLRWWQRLTAAPGVQLATLTPDVLVAASFLPEFDHRDPGDRIIVATAREHGYRIVTRDRRILAYADSGFCRALAC
jgi:PIN domain nuclease of toxin-antitoxin system